MVKRLMSPALATVIAVAALIIPASATAAATTPTPATTASMVASATDDPAVPSTTKLCKNFTGSPCWAKTKLPSGAPICESGLPVPLYLRSGGKNCWPTGDLFLIGCWYTGTPTVLGDSIEDHVNAEETEFGIIFTYVGHTPDVYIDLGGHDPADVGITHCT